MSYALITGAGDGIGKEQALELARSGMNLILVSRSEDKLILVGKECEKINPKIHVTIQTTDFSKAKPKDYKELFESEKIKGKNIRILVNNVGQIDRMRFFDLTPEHVEGIVKVNLMPQIFLTKYAKLLMKKDQQEQSAIIHTASIGCEMRFPFTAEYSGAKRFNAVFGRIIGF